MQIMFIVFCHVRLCFALILVLWQENFVIVFSLFACFNPGSIFRLTFLDSYFFQNLVWSIQSTRKTCGILYCVISGSCDLWRKVCMLRPTLWSILYLFYKYLVTTDLYVLICFFVTFSCEQVLGVHQRMINQLSKNNNDKESHVKNGHNAFIMFHFKVSVPQ